jgi:hypothetical protein
VLSSSVFIYNTKNVIDASALDGLQLSSLMAKEFVDKQHSDNLQDHFPLLIWAIRDWFLDFQVPGNDDPSSDDYMEHCLQNEQCEGIRDHFRERKCFAFPCPVASMKRMRDLGSIGESELDSDFLLETQNLLAFIRQEANSKKIQGESMNGKAFAMFLQSLVKSIQEKKVNIKSTYEYVESTTNKDAYSVAIDDFKVEFEKQVPSYPGKLST